MVAAPQDQDNDFLDNIWELQHSYLNLLNPNDAFHPSPEADAGGRNNLDYYRFKRGIIPLKEAITREVTVFNFGQPTARVEAIAREISVFNGQGVPTGGIPEVYSREVSAFNFGSPLAAVEAISRVEQRPESGQAVPGGVVFAAADFDAQAHPRVGHEVTVVAMARAPGLMRVVADLRALRVAVVGFDGGVGVEDPWLAQNRGHAIAQG